MLVKTIRIFVCPTLHKHTKMFWMKTINGVLELFPEPSSMFDNIVFDDSIVELTWFHIKVDESSTSNTFSFKKSSMTGMLWKIQDSYFSAKLSTGTIVNFIPRSLSTWAKLVELSINRGMVTVTHTNNLKVSSMINILLKKKGMHLNLAGVPIGWLDTPGKRSYLHQITTSISCENQ